MDLKHRKKWTICGKPLVDEEKVEKKKELGRDILNERIEVLLRLCNTKPKWLASPNPFDPPGQVRGRRESELGRALAQRREEEIMRGLDPTAWNWAPISRLMRED